ncbi:MAG TPA: hypothetical protein VKA77_09075 [Mycobacterium sp.]|nr:hypothetical protein [Mycobacterium sp.]
MPTAGSSLAGVARGSLSSPTRLAFTIEPPGGSAQPTNHPFAKLPLG